MEIVTIFNIFPHRWMAPEVFVSKSLTKAADVWSYGVTMWELFNCGAIPYNRE